jgi:hypothetical protein
MGKKKKFSLSKDALENLRRDMFLRGDRGGQQFIDHIKDLQKQNFLRKGRIESNVSVG